MKHNKNTGRHGVNKQKTQSQTTHSETNNIGKD